MAHTSTRIYIDTSTTPPSGVSVYDVQSVLAEQYSDVGNLCISQNINRWAKNKPVRSSALKVLTLADLQDVYFGLDVPIYGTGKITVIQSFLDAFATAYAYLRPRGKGNGESGADEWFRLRDFDGYNSAAVAFTFPEGSTLPHWYRYGDSGGGINFSIVLNSGIGLDGGIAASEWRLDGSTGTAFSDMYFGLIFVGVENNQKRYKIITASYALGDSRGLTIHIDDTNNDGLDGLTTGTTYTVYPVLSTNVRSMVAVGNVSNDTFVAIPIEPFTFQQISVITQLTLTLEEGEAELDYRMRLRVRAAIGMVTTGGFSSIEVVATLFRAAYDGDDSGTQLENTVSYTMIGVTPSQPGEFDTGLLATMVNPPAWVRIHAVASNQAGVQADFYVLVTENTL